MKKIFFLLFVNIAGISVYAQSNNVGIGTNSPVTQLDVNGSFRTKPLTPNANGGSGNIPATVSSFGVSGSDWVSPLVLPANPAAGQRMSVYSTAGVNTIISTTNTYLANGVTMVAGDMYEFVGDGVNWTINPTGLTSAVDATRFLGGTIGVKFNKVSGSASTANNPLATSPIGGIDITSGSGYTIINPSNGLFEITLVKPFIQILGVSLNILDAYGSTGTNVSVGDPPNFGAAGTKLKTTDNTQVSWVTGSKVIVKTGNSVGALSNRSFTFLVTGR